ncbi:N-terminal nucleophile aminohydrolase [Linderina pennispora]|uniref:N-terminal nucleophile aminohydrolase n=1 Tax=Linderina pennispora TaxID=61395 RepID=A0A1Y1WI16_9FUNG|nr:N-terminal nucleophile aminohydrolase [Linderina pennispora]ORX73153.1 N-terminal nucleophile aminohydrolase [Linderina pennispora]
MSIMEYNGSAVVAMVGKNCVAIAADKRLGQRALTVDMNFQKVFPITDRTAEERIIEPKTFSNLVSHMLYERRFGPYFVEPVIAGLDKDNKPFVGTASDNLFGMCESLWEPDLEPEELFETISQALLNAVDRDAMSGWGAVVHVITKDGVITRDLKGRMD